MAGKLNSSSIDLLILLVIFPNRMQFPLGKLHSVWEYLLQGQNWFLMWSHLILLTDKVESFCQSVFYVFYVFFLSLHFPCHCFFSASFASLFWVYVLTIVCIFSPSLLLFLLNPLFSHVVLLSVVHIIPQSFLIWSCLFFSPWFLFKFSHSLISSSFASRFLTHVPFNIVLSLPLLPQPFRANDFFTWFLSLPPLSNTLCFPSFHLFSFFLWQVKACQRKFIKKKYVHLSF